MIAKQIGMAAERLGYKLKLPVDTNFVFLDLEELGVSNKTLKRYCEEYGLRVLESNRIAVHHQITQRGVDRLSAALTALMKDIKTGRINGA